MTISNLIEVLSVLKDAHGNIEVWADGYTPPGFRRVSKIKGASISYNESGGFVLLSRKLKSNKPDKP